MRTTRNVTLASAVLFTLALASCSGSAGTTAGDGSEIAADKRATTTTTEGRPSAGAPDRRSSSTAPTTSTTLRRLTAAPLPTTTTPPTTTPPPTTTARPARPARLATTAPRSDEPRFVCPQGGLDEVAALQRSVDQGHQPWRSSPETVAAACTFGSVDTSVEPAGDNRYRVTHDVTGESSVVEVAQPLGPDTIWVAVTVTPG